MNNDNIVPRTKPWCFSLHNKSYHDMNKDLIIEVFLPFELRNPNENVTNKLELSQILPTASALPTLSILIKKEIGYYLYNCL